MNAPFPMLPSALRPGLRWLVLGLVALTTVACGPVQSTSEISAAEGYLERARVNDAETLSPYEYERAELYLYKAQQEWGYSNFEAARDFADVARRAARAAIDNAREAPWRGHPIYGFDMPGDMEQYQQELRDSTDPSAVDAPEPQTP